MSTTQKAQRVSAEQYRALQSPFGEAELSPRQLFDYIVETLVAKDLASYDVADPFRNSIPSGLFNLIPPRIAEMDLNELMSLIRVDGKQGISYLESKFFGDGIVLLTPPYLIFDIEDGRKRLDTPPAISQSNIEKENRSPFTLFEGIMHGIVFPEVFASHHIDLCGSRYKSRQIPYLYLGGGEVSLRAHLSDVKHPKWGAPSCGGRKRASA